MHEFSLSGAPTSRRAAVRAEIVGLRANDGEFPAEAAISQIRFEGATCLPGVPHDVTDQRRAVRIDCDVDDDSLRVQITDTGPGIPEAEIPYIFDRFSRLRRDHRGGAGLGLTIARASLKPRVDASGWTAKSA